MDSNPTRTPPGEEHDRALLEAACDEDPVQFALAWQGCGLGTLDDILGEDDPPEWVF